MATISSYPTIAPSGSDLVLIVDTSATGNPTKTATVSSIASQVTLGYTSYVASLIQAGTAAPVATVLQNTTGGTFTWSRTSTGKYKATISGITLPANKVVIFENATNDLNLGGKITSSTVIDIDQFSSGGGGYSDVMLPGTSIEIRIYS